MNRSGARAMDAPTFSDIIVRNQDGFREAAKLIAEKLNIDKPLFLYLSLKDYETETVMDFIAAITQS